MNRRNTSGRTKDSSIHQFWHLPVPLPTGCRTNRMSQNTCVSSIVCNLTMWPVEVTLVQFCTLTFVPYLFIPNLKSTSRKFFGYLVSKYYYYAFSWSVKYAPKLAVSYIYIIYHSSFEIESFSGMTFKFSFSHENPSWLSKWNLTKWILYWTWSQRRLSAYIQLTNDVTFFCHWEVIWSLYSHGQTESVLLFSFLFLKKKKQFVKPKSM